MSGPMSDSKNFELSRLQLSGSRLVPGGATAPGRGREKERIVGEIFLPGANVSAIARSHGLDPSQLFAWRRKALASGLVAPVEAPGIGGLTTCGELNKGG